MTVGPLILAVDDEPSILRLVKNELSSQGFRVVTALNGGDALAIFDQQRPDMAILDIMLPDMSGLEVMHDIRERRNIPIMLLTGRDKSGDKVRGLELGADDYLAKPFNPDELSARVRSVLRRGIVAEDRKSIVSAGNVKIDLQRRLARKDGELVRFTRTEWMLLEHLASNPGRVVVSTELLAEVWGPEYRTDFKYLRVWVSRLRGKLEDDPPNWKIIKTIQGVGYILDADGGIQAALGTAGARPRRGLTRRPAKSGDTELRDSPISPGARG